MELYDIWGNETAKRAVQIAHRGNFSIKFIGGNEAELFRTYCLEHNLTAYAMKPCLCGYLGHPTHECLCSRGQIKEAQAIIAGTPTDLTINTIPNLLTKINGELPVKLDTQCQSLLLAAIKHLSLGQAEVLSIVKVAKAISLMDQALTIKPNHLAEALQYRS